MSQRDEFSAEVKRVLAARVNSKCSRPSCEATTSGPHSNFNKAVNVGVAAHITAAAPGGPRYDAALTPEQREGIDNGIWLCTTCSVLIDKDAAAFPFELLNQWKKDAESKALAVIGKPQSQDDLHRIKSQAFISQLAETVSIQARTINRLTLEVPAAPNTENTPDDRWKGDVERALRWSESGELSKIEAAKAIVAEVRGDADFEQLSPVLRARLATAVAVCAVHVGDNDAAEKEVTEALRLQPENVACLSNAAGVAVMRDDFERATVLAQQVREKEPRNENAAMVLVQSWHYTGQAKHIGEFLRDNSWFLDLPNGCAVLGQIRSRDGRYEEAIQLAKQGLKKDRKHVQSLEVLYDALFSPLRDKMLNSAEWDYSARSKRYLKRAEAAISRAISILEEGPNRDKLHQALSNRAAVLSAQEKTDDAFADCDRILHNNPSPNSRDFATLNKALILIHVGRAAEALPLLESLKSERWRQDGAFALAYSYHVAGQSVKALGIWKELWKPQECDAAQMMTAAMLLWVYRRENNHDAADSVLSRVLKACPDDPRVSGLVAQDKYDRGDVDGAIELLRATALSCQESGNEAARVQMLLTLGDISYRVGRFTDTTQAWREVGWERLLPPHRGAFLNALYQTGELVEALEVARLIQKEVGFAPRAAETEAAICAYMGDYKEACKLWEELSRREPQNPLHNINRTHAALHGENEAEARSALQRVPYESIKDDASSLRRVSVMQARLGFKEAIRFAFRARQIDFGNPESHRNYFTIFIDSTNSHSRGEDGEESNTRAADVLGLNGPKWGEVPCTIRLLPVGVDDERRKRSFTILKEGPFDQARGIYPPQHDLVQRLLALKPDETITLRQSPTNPEQQYRIVEVLSPYVHAFQESGLESASWFGEDAGVWSIDVRDGFDNFWAFMDAAGRGFEEVIKLYADWRFPLCTVGTVRSRSLFDLWFFVGSRPQWGIHAERGVTPIFEQAVEHLQAKCEKPALVLDSTSLMALVHLGLADNIAPHFRLLVSQSLRREVKKLSDELLLPHIPNDLPQKLLDFIDSHTEVLPAKAVIQFQPADIQQWQRTLGQTELDAALLAYEHDALLYADDAILREAARIHPGVEGVSTQAILETLYRREQLRQDVYFETLEKLSVANYRYLLLSAEFFIWLLGKHENAVNKSVRAAFRYLEGPRCDADAAVVITAFILKTIWTSNPKCKRRFDMLDWCLMSLVTGRPINSMLDKLERMLLHPQLGLRDKRDLLREIFDFVEQFRERII